MTGTEEAEDRESKSKNLPLINADDTDQEVAKPYHG